MQKGVKGIFAGLVLTGGVYSGSAGAEDLIEIYQLALKNDPTYQAGFHEHEASKEIYSQAKAVLLPTIKFDFSETETTQDIISSDNAVFSSGSTSYPTTEMTLSLTQSVYSFSNWAYFKQAKEDVKRVAAELEDVRQDLMMRTAENYFAALREYDNYTAVQSEVASLEKHYELVSQQRQDGLARVTDELDAQARFMQAKAREVEIRNTLKDALQGLKEMTGQLPQTLAPLGIELELIDPNPAMPEEWVEKSRNNNPMVIAKRYASSVAYQEVRRQKGGHYPTLDFVLTQNTRETQGSLFGGGSEVETQDMMLKLTVPIYAGGAVSSKVREAVELHNKAKDELEIEWRATERETYAAFDGVVGSIAKVEALQRSVDAYELGVDAKRTAYESGLTSSLSVLDAERDLFFARTDFSSARYDYLVNMLRLKRAVGMLKEEDLSAINRSLADDEQTFDITARVMDSRTYRRTEQAIR
ncbi:TolC family outer membrane protein [Neptuniibacter caesariensis]|uniref:Outer membrane protein n=1 Tax=Neptuniibacter caesariensis TaxID=207954 RepID=A0A7U8C513_NEPCE|nr:TolC family outer membrane protein [Neptuniibacter caesariensis]EAR60230.1 Outer membrane protein [Oceanospirillum sp. MED92] [Neptuniibacter caesariensis]